MVLRLCRYRERDAAPAPIWEATCAMAARAESLAEPRALLRRVRIVAAGPDRVRLDGGAPFSGRAIARLLAGCSLAVPFALTLGPRLEVEVAELTERQELLEAFLLNMAGWAAIEVVVRALRQDLVRRARAEGLGLTHRLAPGYQDWPLTEQQALLDVLGPGQDLVRLSEHGVLVPFKSITGCFGLVPARGEAPSRSAL
jgi:hypothetical protein